MKIQKYRGRSPNDKYVAGALERARFWILNGVSEDRGSSSFSQEGVGQGMGPESARFGISHALTNSNKSQREI